MLIDRILVAPAPQFRLRHWARGVLARVLAADALHRQMIALASLDPRMLRDIGLTDADVERELRVRGHPPRR